MYVSRACGGRTPDHFGVYIYAVGGVQAPTDAFRAFRGRLPTSDALRRRGGLAEASVQAG